MSIIPEIELLRERLRGEGYCSFRGRDMQLVDGLDEDLAALRMALDGGGDDGHSRKRFFARYLLGLAWTPETSDLDVRSHAFLGFVAVARIGYGERMTETPTKTMNDALSKVVKRLHYPLEVMRSACAGMRRIR